MNLPGKLEQLAIHHPCNAYGTGFHAFEKRHNRAWREPLSQRERAVKNLIVGFAALCDSSQESDITLGKDGFFHEHASYMVQGLLAMLNLECGRYDCGTLDRLIREIAKQAEVEIHP